MNNQVSEYINCAPTGQKEVMERIRQLIHASVPHVLETFKWSRPVFSANKDFAYLKTSKVYVTLGFFNFEKLDDPNKLLEGTGEDMRHIKIKTAKDIDDSLLTKWFKSASE